MGCGNLEDDGNGHFDSFWKSRKFKKFANWNMVGYQSTYRARVWFTFRSNYRYIDHISPIRYLAISQLSPTLAIDYIDAHVSLLNIYNFRGLNHLAHMIYGGLLSKDQHSKRPHGYCKPVGQTNDVLSQTNGFLSQILGLCLGINEESFWKTETE